MQKKHVRGKELENKFDKIMRNLVNVFQISAHRLNVDKAVYDGQVVYKKKEPSDYLIVSFRSVWLIDTKECSSSRFYLSKQPAHQKKAMEEFKNIRKDARSGFVVWFKKEDPAGVNFRFIEDMNLKSCDITSGVRFDWEEIVK